MTAPALPPLQVHAEDLQTRLRHLADSTGDDAAGVLAARVDGLRVDLTALWVRMFGGVDRMPPTLGDAARFARQARARASEALNPALVDGDVLPAAIRQAHGMGVDHALDTTPALPLSLPVRDEQDGPDLSRPVREALAHALSALSDSSVQTSGYAAVGVGVARAERAPARIRASVAWEVTRAASDGVRDVATQTGSHVLWVAERDGCLHCLAYAGQSTTASGVFPPGLTFGDRALALPEGVPFTGPPLHPHCRCTLEVFDPADVQVAAGLRREAKRSVLRGWSIDSDPARIRAADRLLEQGAGLPKTVEARARAAVKAGTFGDEAFPSTPTATPRPAEDPRPLAESRDVRETVATTGNPSGNPSEGTPIGLLSDSELDDAMTAAMEAEDWDLVDEITAELDARDAAATAPPEPPEAPETPETPDGWAEAWGIVEAQDVEDVDDEEAHRLETMAVLIEQGMSETEAYGVAYGVASDRLARDRAIKDLREQGFTGRGFEELARLSYRDYCYRAYIEAEGPTRGAMLNRAGRAASIDPFSLFSGPLTRAAKYASDELKDWWEENERFTFEEWKARLLDDSAALRRARYYGSGRRFER